MIAAVLAAEGEPSNVVEWFTNREARDFEGPIPDQIFTTVWHALAALGITLVIFVPLAVVLSHYRKADLLGNWLAGMGRAIPTITIVSILVVVSLREGFGFEPWPILIALVLLAIPPIFTNTYTAVRGVDGTAVSAGRAMGLTERQLMGRIELPLAVPVILAGARVAAVQLVATEPLAAFFGAEGLGAYIRQGLANRNVYETQAGALLVAGVAIAVDLTLYLAVRLALPRGITRSAPTRRRKRKVDQAGPGSVPEPAA